MAKPRIEWKCGSCSSGIRVTCGGSLSAAVCCLRAEPEPLTACSLDCRSIASWALAIAAFGAWYSYDRKKEREFSSDEVAQWNQQVLASAKAKTKKKEEQQ